MHFEFENYNRLMYLYPSNISDFFIKINLGKQFLFINKPVLLL